MNRFIHIAFIFIIFGFAEIKANQYIETSFYNLPTTEYSNKSTLTIFPNPAIDFVRIKSSNLFVRFKEIKVIDIVGNEMFHVTGNNFSTAELNISQLRKGKYLIKVTYSDNTEEATQLVKL